MSSTNNKSFNKFTSLVGDEAKEKIIKLVEKESSSFAKELREKLANVNRNNRKSVYKLTEEIRKSKNTNKIKLFGDAAEETFCGSTKAKRFKNIQQSRVTSNLLTDKQKRKMIARNSDPLNRNENQSDAGFVGQQRGYGISYQKSNSQFGGGGVQSSSLTVKEKPLGIAGKNINTGFALGGGSNAPRSGFAGK